MAERIERRLTTILAADVAEYSRLMRADEDSTLALLTRRREVAAARIAEYRGRIANTAVDAVLAEFPSVADGLSCALAIQEAVGKANEALPADRGMLFRIGVRRRSQCCGTAASARRARPDLRLGGGARACREPRRCCLHRCRRAAAQEHRRASACLPRGGKPGGAGDRGAGAAVIA